MCCTTFYATAAVESSKNCKTNQELARKDEESSMWSLPFREEESCRRTTDETSLHLGWTDVHKMPQTTSTLMWRPGPVVDGSQAHHVPSWPPRTPNVPQSSRLHLNRSRSCHCLTVTYDSEVIRTSPTFTLQDLQLLSYSWRSPGTCWHKQLHGLSLQQWCESLQRN